MTSGTPQTRILVVEDEAEMRELLAQRLASWGYEVLTAGDGEEGWRLVQEQHPNLILLDVVMRAMKGREFCERLKANPRTKDIPVIFLTALGLPDHIKAGLDAGGEDYVVKPFQPEDLKLRVSLCLARHAGAPPHNGGSDGGSQEADDPGRRGRAGNGESAPMATRKRRLQRPS